MQVRRFEAIADRMQLQSHHRPEIWSRIADSFAQVSMSFLSLPTLPVAYTLLDNCHRSLTTFTAFSIDSDFFNDTIMDLHQLKKIRTAGM